MQFQTNFSSNDRLNDKTLKHYKINKEVKFEDIETSRVFLKDTSIDQIIDRNDSHELIFGEGKSNGSSTLRGPNGYLNVNSSLASSI